jgi:hypothetical protein
MSDRKTRLDEFREASAQLRHAIQAQAEAREAQILANLRAAETSRNAIAAQDRLNRADAALAEADAESEQAARAPLQDFVGDANQAAAHVEASAILTLQPDPPLNGSGDGRTVI